MRCSIFACLFVTAFPGFVGTSRAELAGQVITGSALPSASDENVFRVTSYDYTDFLKRGANTPAEGLRQDPAYVGNTATENDSNRGDGSARINLFALGSENTLTLVNGRRTFIFDDINGIPIGALARVELWKGGGSAIYGANAVAGVANFVFLNGPGEEPYEGAEIDVLYGNTTDKDARVLQGSVRGGVATDRLEVAVAAEYYDREAIFSRDRDISAASDRRYLGGTNQGSPTFAGRVSFRTNPALGGTNRPSILVDPNEDNPTGAGSYRRFDVSTDTLNFREYTPAIPAMKKAHYFAAARYKVFGDALQLYGELLYAKRKQDNALTPVSFTLSLIGSNASPYNPFVGTTNDNPTVQTTYNDNQLRSVSYRTIRELGLRQSLFDSDSWRYVAGLEGKFAFSDNNFISLLHYDAGLVYERGEYLRVDSGDMLRTPLEAETAAGNFNPFIGLTAPLSGTAVTFRNGVPTATDVYDNVAAAERAAYIARSFSYDRSALLELRARSNLFPSLYQGGIGFGFGAEHRSTRSTHIPDPIQDAGNQLGFTARPRSKFRQEVTSWFGELHVPIVTPSLNIPGLRMLSVAAAYRQEEFENHDPLTTRSARFDNDGSTRLAISYEPVVDLTLHASWERSFRAPTAENLFEPTTSVFYPLFDPLTSLVTNVEVIQGGNVALRPEQTNSYSAGVAWTPRLIPRLAMSANLYQHYTREVILPSEDFAQLILSATAGNVIIGDIIIRDEGTNLPILIFANTANAGKRLVNGLDVTAAYQLPWTNFGTFTFSLGYNHFFTWKAEPVEGFGSANFTGDYNNGTLALAPGAVPRHKGFLRGEYDWKGFNFVATTNYISSYLDDPAFLLLSEYSPNGERDPNTRTVSDYITLDMQMSYEFVKPEAAPAAAGGYSKGAKGRKAMHAAVAGVEQGRFFERMLWGTKLRVGVVNAFDRRPPTVLAAFNDNHETSLYSIRNRYWYAGLTKTF